MPNVRPRPEKDCPTCGKHFICTHPKQKFCSKKCIRHGRAHLICPCGVSTGSYQKKYCSPEHHEQYRKHKAPTEMVTHLCLGCGETFERPVWYPGKKKYCSNKCAHREQKMTTEVGALLSNDRTLIFRSTWEMRFYCVCLRFDIPIRSYDGPDIDTSHGIYRPDFILGEGREEVVVDVKGWLRPESNEKLKEARSAGHLIKIIPKDLLLRLESGDSLDAHRALMWQSILPSEINHESR